MHFRHFPEQYKGCILTWRANILTQPGWKFRARLFDIKKISTDFQWFRKNTPKQQNWNWECSPGSIPLTHFIFTDTQTHTHPVGLWLLLCVFLSFLRLHPDGSIQANDFTVDHGVFSNGRHEMSKLSRVTQARWERHLSCEKALHLLRKTSQQWCREQTCVEKWWDICKHTQDHNTYYRVGVCLKQSAWQRCSACCIWTEVLTWSNSDNTDAHRSQITSNWKSHSHDTTFRCRVCSLTHLINRGKWE